MRFLLTFFILHSLYAQMLCESKGNYILDFVKKKHSKTSLNVFNEKLSICSNSPLTGYFRDGTCRTNSQDLGNHSLCVQMSEEFLSFTKKLGNDLTTPSPRYQFPGLKPGDYWCVCASRWLEAKSNGIITKVKWESSHSRALEVVSSQDVGKVD